MKEYYIKKGRKYIPIGTYELPNYIPYGVWYVRKSGGGTSHTNLDFWKTDGISDIKKMVKQIDFADKFIEALNRMPKDSFSVYGTSLFDFAQKLSQELIKE
jgi:hypothetical protein